MTMNENQTLEYPHLLLFRGFNAIIFDRFSCKIAVIFHNDIGAFRLPGYQLPIPLSHEDIVTHEIPNLVRSMGLEVILDADPPMTVREVFMGLTNIWSCYIAVLEHDHGQAEELAARGQQCTWNLIDDALTLMMGQLNNESVELQRERSFRFLEAFHISGQYY